MEAVVSVIMQYLIQIVVVVIGALGTLVLKTIKEKIALMKENEKTKLIADVVENVVSLMEAELGDGKGAEKKAKAILKVSKLLEEKGIKVSEDEISASIEKAVLNLKQVQVNIKPLELMKEEAKAECRVKGV